jgi:Fic family protein
VNAARRILDLLDTDRKNIEALGRPAASVLRVHQYAQAHPILSIPTAAEHVGMTFPTVAAAIHHMQQLEILREITGKQRGRRFAYGRYLDIVNEGAERLS